MPTWPTVSKGRQATQEEEEEGEDAPPPDGPGEKMATAQTKRKVGVQGERETINHPPCPPSLSLSRSLAYSLQPSICIPK